MAVAKERFVRRTFLSDAHILLIEKCIVIAICFDRGVHYTVRQRRSASPLGVTRCGVPVVKFTFVALGS